MGCYLSRRECYGVHHPKRGGTFLGGDRAPCDVITLSMLCGDIPIWGQNSMLKLASKPKNHPRASSHNVPQMMTSVPHNAVTVGNGAHESGGSHAPTWGLVTLPFKQPFSPAKLIFIVGGSVLIPAILYAHLKFGKAISN